MLSARRGWSGWLVMAALVLGVFFLTYMGEPAVRRASFWGDGWQQTPLAQRVHILPADALAALREGLSDREFMSKVKPAENAEYVVRDVQAALRELPRAVKDLVRDRLVGIYLVEGLAKSENSDSLGMALEVVGFWRQHAGTVILVDRNDTDMRANEAMAGMEYVPSRDYHGVAVEPRLAAAGENDRTTTLRYVLLHEFGHLVEFDRGIVPTTFSYGAPAADCGFACLSWKTPTRHRHSRWLNAALDKVRTGRHDEYVKALPNTFDLLVNSNFPTLYATTLPQEDFAESFAMYVHTVLMRRPWELTLRRDGTIVAELRSCFVDGRCPRKRAYFDRLFETLSR